MLSSGTLFYTLVVQKEIFLLSCALPEKCASSTLCSLSFSDCEQLVDCSMAALASLHQKMLRQLNTVHQEYFAQGALLQNDLVETIYLHI